MVLTLNLVFGAYLIFAIWYLFEICNLLFGAYLEFGICYLVLICFLYLFLERKPEAPKYPPSFTSPRRQRSGQYFPYKIKAKYFENIINACS
jgi:hypothetical protein